MEATGVYWVPLFQILEGRGLEVCLVNARHVKNVPGRKTDVPDCQGLQYLHSVGLLHASFRPPAAVCAVRALVRHRDSLVRTGCEHLLRVQNALDQMNVQVHRAVTDITGETGQAILEAIIKGERKPEVLAQHRDYRCKKSEAEIAAALRGDWRPEHLFEKFGVDLTAVDAVNVQTAYVFLSEVGVDVSKFETADHFVSWLGLCPDNRKTGGRQIGVATRAVANRLSTALRMAAQSLHRVESALGDCFRRMKAKLGAPGATTAAAHKLARVLNAMIKYRQPFDPARLGNPALRQARKENALRRAAKELGYALQPIQAGAVS